MKASSNRALGRLVAILVVAAGAAACGLDATAPDTMDATIEVVDRSTQGLSAGALTAVNGTYGAACKARSGSWSLRVSGTDALAHDPLSVVQNDAACALTVTELVTASTTQALAPAITLGSEYQATGSAVGSGAGAFYANAKLAPVGFPSAFVVTVLTSDAPNVGSVTATYPAVTTTPSVVAVASANINDKLLTIQKPTGTVAGMVMIAAVANEKNNTASLTGWTSLGRSTNVITLDMFYRVAEASEPASYTFVLSGSGRISGGIITVKNANASPIDVIGASASSMIAPSVTTTVDKTLLVGCWANVATASTPPATMTEEWDRAADDKVSCACSVEARPTAGATGTRTATAAGIEPTSRLVAIKP